jgi:serine phosphatase RsbU (regulator of sigma subunit)
MTIKTNPESLPVWGDIIPESENNSLNSEKLSGELINFFSSEYTRIRSAFPSTGYLPDAELFVNEFVTSIPEKLKLLQVSLRQFSGRYFTCIITDEEVDQLASNEHYRWVNKMYATGWTFGEAYDPEARTHPELNGFSDLGRERQKFYRELIYTVPVILNRCGYEIFKPGEQKFFKNELVESLACAIHERYRKMMREMDEKARSESVYEKLNIVNAYNRQYFSVDFNQLPADIRSSNLDSAHHIATKLLSIGYSIKEAARNSGQMLVCLSDSEIETMAKLEHERWAWEKRHKGFSFASVRNDALKTHPCLIPYIELPELEKEKDRVLVKIIPALLTDINYSVFALSPEQLRNISYIPMQRILLQESIYGIEKTIQSIESNDIQKGEETKRLKNNLAESLINIRATIEEQYGASMIQQCILPTRLFFRSCLPDSFILYKPKDILSGDFYFISRINNLIIFAAADCTGHGTAGAMLSMICSNFLDQAVNDNNLTDPSMIIGFVYKKLVGFMKRHDNSVVSDYGMEIAVCTLIPETNKLMYAGINRALYLFRNTENIILEAQKIRAGNGYESLLNTIQPSLELNLKKGDSLYIFSDGYADQFGGKENKKFLNKNLANLLKDIQPKTMLEQYETLSNTIEEWKGTGTESAQEQTDDILLIGVRI